MDGYHKLATKKQFYDANDPVAQKLEGALVLEFYIWYKSPVNFICG